MGSRASVPFSTLELPTVDRCPLTPAANPNDSGRDWRRGPPGSQVRFSETRKCKHARTMREMPKSDKLTL